MYVTDLFFEGAAENGCGRFRPLMDRGGLHKWTLLPATPAATELLQLLALACGGPAHLWRLPGHLGRWCRCQDVPLHLELVFAPHAPRDGRENLPPLRGSGVEITGTGAVQGVGAGGYRYLPASVPRRKLALGSGNTRCFFVAYGPTFGAHNDTDRFDFSDPSFRVTRFASLFDTHARLTDPVALLSRLHDKVRLGRFPAKQVLARLGTNLGSFLDIPVAALTERGCDFRRGWAELLPWQQRVLVPVLDAVRHAVDASPFQPQPLDIPGLLLFDHPDRFCPEASFPRWTALIDRLFPEAQCVLTLSATAAAAFPAELRRGRLALPTGKPPSRKAAAKARPGSIVLIDVDGTLPNLALMKLSRHHKEQGRDVVLARKDDCLAGTEAAYASCIISRQHSLRRVARLRKHYGEGLSLGGSGVDLVNRLPPEIEELPPDLHLYPELRDRAIGFLTRGCPFDCPFCVVPIKEGPPRQVSDLDTLLQRRRKLILLDDNILAHRKAGEFLEELASRGVQVNFTQTLDLHLVDREKAQLLRRVSSTNTKFTRPVYYFSLNNADDLDRVRHKYDLFGFTSKDNVEFVCMYGYDTTLEQDVARFRFLRSLPGAYVFVQEYMPVPGTPPEETEEFFGPNPDRLIRELVSICFTQNMKSMEKYYRWLSKRYARSFGALNDDLVETLFRYNNRSHKGVYMATLAHTIRRRDAKGIHPA